MTVLLSFFRNDLHAYIPFLARSMAIAVDQWLVQSQHGLADVSVCHSAPAIKEEKVDRMRFTTSFTQATVLVLRSKCS